VVPSSLVALSSDVRPWVTLAVLWGANSIRHRFPNMWTLIGLGAGAASTSSVDGHGSRPGLLPEVFRR
jgi:hypothetical protein